MNCNFMHSHNKTIFLCLLVLQLVQSSTFSSMFEVPLFFTIMFLAACFLYRAKMKVAYAQLSHFLVVYIQVAALLKVLY